MDVIDGGALPAALVGSPPAPVCVVLPLNAGGR
jgi:hypothetical protein